MLPYIIESKISLQVFLSKTGARLLFCQSDIVFDHSVDFHAHLLVDLPLDKFSINEKGDQESQGHQQENKEHCKPEIVCLVQGLRSSLVLDETVTLFWLGQQRIAYHLKNLRRLEQTVKVLTVYNSLGIENYVLLVSFSSHPIKDVLLVEFGIIKLIKSVGNILLDGLNEVVGNSALLHGLIRASFNVLDFETQIVVEYVHVFKPDCVLVFRQHIKQQIHSERFLKQLTARNNVPDV